MCQYPGAPHASCFSQRLHLHGPLDAACLGSPSYRRGMELPSSHSSVAAMLCRCLASLRSSSRHGSISAGSQCHRQSHPQSGRADLEPLLKEYARLKRGWLLPCLCRRASEREGGNERGSECVEEGWKWERHTRLQPYGWLTLRKSEQMKAEVPARIRPLEGMA